MLSEKGGAHKRERYRAKKTMVFWFGSGEETRVEVKGEGNEWEKGL